MIISISVVSFIYHVTHTYTHTHAFTHILYIYSMHAGLQIVAAVIILAYKRPEFSVLMLIPPIATIIEIAIVAVDLKRNTWYSVYTSPLLAVPIVFRAIPRTKYAQLCVQMIVFSIFLILNEVLLLSKYLIDKGIPRYWLIPAIFCVYYTVTALALFSAFLKSTLSMLIAFCNLFRQFHWRKNLVIWFNSSDLMLCAIAVGFGTVWLFSYESLSREKYPEYAKEEIDLERSAYSLFEKTLLAGVIYSVISSLILYICTTWNPRPHLGNQTSSNSSHIHGPSNIRSAAFSNPGITNGQGLVPTQLGDQQAISRSQVRSRQPESTASRFLNLFRLNANFFVDSIEDGQQADMLSDNLCTICYAKPSNCIILDCKHGGICEDCAWPICDKNKCPFCRESIARICVVKQVGPNRYEVTKEIKSY